MGEPLRGLRGDLPGVVHGREHVRDGAQFVGITIRGDGDAASPDALEGMAARAAAQVQHPVAAFGAEPLVVDSEHQRLASALIADVRGCLAGTSASNARYCSTVLRAVAAHE